MNNTFITIRRAAAPDADLLAQLGRQTFFDSFASFNTPDNITAYLAASFNLVKQSAELAEPGTTFLIAQVGDETVGYARLHAGPPEECVRGPMPIELVRIYAVKAWIGHGVGAALMQACLDEAARQGYQTIWLGVWEQNPRAIAFYEKWGFQKVGTHNFQLGDEAQTDWIMERTV